MNSSLKIIVPLVLLLCGVFALTYLAQYKPQEEDAKDETVVTTKKPLQFFTSSRQWFPRPMWDEIVRNGEPPPGTLQDTEFAGFYEPGETQNIASYWFSNTSPAPVKIRLKHVSCSTCSGGKVASLPTDLTKQILQMAAISALPQGFMAGFPIAMAVPAAQLDSKRDVLKWKYHAFLNADEVEYDVPGAPTGDKWAEQWGIVDLHFKAKPGGNIMNHLTATFTTSAGGDPAQHDDTLALNYMSAPPFELDRSSIDAGELTDASAPQTHEVLIFSCTRKPAQIPKFDVTVTMPGTYTGEPGPFVSASKPVLVPVDEYLRLSQRLSNEKKRPVRVQSAYRMAIAVSPKVGESKMDIGRLERNVNVTFGADNVPVFVTGSMRGPISLANAKEISFGIFAYSDAQTVTVTVETERTGVDLRIVPEFTSPKKLQLELQKQADFGERGVYKLKATLPAKEQLGEIHDGVVVLETAGPNPLRLRIPVSGRGR
jgi:hypothetical protein